VTTAANPRAIAGGNNPPSPFDEVKAEIETLFEEAKGWLDGEAIANQGQADDLNKLMSMIREAEKKAEALRKEEAKPFDDGKAEVQARYNPLIQKGKGLTALALSAAKKALTPWLEKLDREKREAEAKARQEAEEAAKKAAEAFRLSDQADLEARQEAERLAEEAKQKDIAARKAANDKARAKSGDGRATSLRTYHTPEITDYTAFARWCWRNRQEAMREFLDGQAKQLVREQPERAVDGMKVHVERRAV